MGAPHPSTVRPATSSDLSSPFLCCVDNTDSQQQRCCHCAQVRPCHTASTFAPFLLGHSIIVLPLLMHLNHEDGSLIHLRLLFDTLNVHGRTNGADSQLARTFSCTQLLCPFVITLPRSSSRSQITFPSHTARRGSTGAVRRSDMRDSWSIQWSPCCVCCWGLSGRGTQEGTAGDIPGCSDAPQRCQDHRGAPGRPALCWQPRRYDG